jgi:hypothetical protein
MLQTGKRVGEVDRLLNRDGEGTLSRQGFDLGGGGNFGGWRHRSGGRIGTGVGNGVSESWGG